MAKKKPAVTEMVSCSATYPRVTYEFEDQGLTSQEPRYNYELQRYTLRFVCRAVTPGGTAKTSTVYTAYARRVTKEKDGTLDIGHVDVRRYDGSGGPANQRAVEYAEGRLLALISIDLGVTPDSDPPERLLLGMRQRRVGQVLENAFAHAHHSPAYYEKQAQRAREKRAKAVETVGAIAAAQPDVAEFCREETVRVQKQAEKEEAELLKEDGEDYE